MHSIPQKPCRVCGLIKPLTDFSKHKQMADGHVHQCKTCCNAYARKRVESPEEREKRNARARKKYATSEATRKRKRDNLRRRYHENPEHRRKQMEWSNAAIHRRRARREANGGSYTVREWKAVCLLYDHRCLCCGERKPLTVDHVIPLALGGMNTIDNIQPLCLDCNLRKHARTVDYRDSRTLVQLGLVFDD